MSLQDLHYIWKSIIIEPPPFDNKDDHDGEAKNLHNGKDNAAQDTPDKICSVSTTTSDLMDNIYHLQASNSEVLNSNTAPFMNSFIYSGMTAGNRASPKDGDLSANIIFNNKNTIEKRMTIADLEDSNIHNFYSKVKIRQDPDTKACLKCNLNDGEMTLGGKMSSYQTMLKRHHEMIGHDDCILLTAHDDSKEHVKVEVFGLTQKLPLSSIIHITGSHN